MKIYEMHWIKIIFDKLDLIISAICSFVGICIIFLSYIGKINQVFIGLILLAAPLMYILIKSRLGIKIPQAASLSFRAKLSVNIIFWVLFCVAAITWYNQIYSRPLIFFIEISLLSGLVAVEILFYNKSDSSFPVLFKIFMLELLVWGGIYYNFPSIIGYDAFTHAKIAELISTTGYIPPFDISDKYINYPVLHILISIFKITSFVNIKAAIFLSIGLTSIIICTLFTFLLLKYLIGPKYGLAAALIVALTAQIINNGLLNITAGSLVFCLFLILFYILIIPKRLSAIILSLSLFITIIMILTHQLSTFVVFLICCLLVASLYSYDLLFSAKIQNFNYLLYLVLFGMSMFFYWMYTIAYNGSSFFETALNPFMDTLKFGSQYGSDILIVGHEYARPLIETILLQSSYLILPFFALGGLFYWLSQKDLIKFSIAALTGALFFLTYTLPLLGSRDLLTSRWMPFLTIFLGILAAVYIFTCVDLIQSIKGKIVVIFTIIMVFSFLMITVPMVNKDNPIVAKDTTVRNQFTTNELTASEWIGLFHSGSVIVDSSFVSAVLFYGSDNTVNGQIQLSTDVNSFASIDYLLETSTKTGSLTVLREVTLNEPLSFKASKLYGDTYAMPLPKKSFEYFENTNSQNKIYTNENVIGFYAN